MTDRYDIPSLVPYIDWTYYWHAWMVKGGTPEADALRGEALTWLYEHRDAYSAQVICHSFEAHSEGDDIIILPADGSQPVVIPMLRQQRTGPDGCTLSLSDFVRPDHDTLHLFATSVDIPDEDLVAQTLAVRLAEAAAEKLDHNLHHLPQGQPLTSLRPAVGYPCMPDLSINFLIDELIGFDNIGIRLTENGAMKPQASVSGFIIDEPRARYFAVGPISEEQLDDYARRRRLSPDVLRPFLHLLTHS